MKPPNTFTPPKKTFSFSALTAQLKQGASLTTTATFLAIVMSHLLSGRGGGKILFFAPMNTVLNVFAPIHKAFIDPPKILTPICSETDFV
jgi:hypothetical protein